jgi:hypothetical protein
MNSVLSPLARLLSAAILSAGFAHGALAATGAGVGKDGKALLAQSGGTRNAAPAAGAQGGSGASPAVKSATPPAATAAEVNGFRSARFGMSEDEVKAAIAKDFSIRAADIKVEPNVGEKTNVFTVRVPNLIPDGGAADVSYVFGYKSKQLIQVGVLWSAATDPKMQPEGLQTNAKILASYFQTAGYAPQNVAVNVPIPGGVVVFRGADAKGRMTLLILHAAPAAEGDKTPPKPTALTLYYTADPLNPDVFRLPPGQF